MISDKLMMLQSELNTAKYQNEMATKLIINSGSYICMATCSYNFICISSYNSSV